MAAALLSACSDPPPVSIDLKTLSEYQMEVDGRVVVVSGTLRSFHTPRHYWIENQALDRVALEGADGLPALVDRNVEVRGIFTYDQAKGRRIEVSELRALP